MDSITFTQAIFAHAQRALDGAVDGLSHEELKWQPDPEANSIGFLLWHQTRAEDSFVQGMFLQKPQVWTTEKWYQKFNMPDDPQVSGWGYTAEQIAALPVPELAVLLGYANAVRAKTMEYLKSITPEKLDEVITTPFREQSIGQVLSMLLCEIIQHTGHIAYVRGLKRGLNK